jgi:toxin YoeB
VEIKYNLIYTKRAVKDIHKLKAAQLADKARALCESLVIDPMPSYSKQLVGDLYGKRSIRINLKHRLVYEIHEKQKTIKVLSMWSHYE